MSEQSTATPTTDSTPSPAPAQSFDSAGAQLRAATSWADVVPTQTPEPTQPEAAPASPAVAEAHADPDPAATAEGDSEGVEFTQDETGRWHRADGTYATNEETAQLNAQSAEPEPSAPEPIVVAIKGRNGEAVEIEVADEKAADLLRANANDGMRREEFTRRMATVEAKEAELREFETMLQANPEAVILKHLPADKQVSIATALVAQHWDAILGRLAEFDSDPSQRIAEAARTQIAMRDQDTEYRERVDNARYYRSIESAAESLIPENVDADTQARFLDYAGRDLARHIQSHGRISPDQVKEILAPTIALFRFSEAGSATGGSTTAATPPTPPARPVARLLSKPQGSATTTPSAPAPGQSPSTTVRRLVRTQAVAAAVPPAGAGAAPLSRPALPSTATLADVVASQKKHKTWGVAS